MKFINANENFDESLKQYGYDIFNTAELKTSNLAIPDNNFACLFISLIDKTLSA